MVGVWFAFKLQPVQQYAAQKATVFLAEKLKTKVTVGSFTTDWQNSVVLRDFYLQDQKNDTLIYAEKLGVDLNFKDLLQRKIRVNSVEIKNGRVNFYTTAPDSTYNYEFIKTAFAGKNTQTDTARSFTFKLKRLDLKAIRLRLHDPVRGKFITGKIGKLAIAMQEFDAENSIFRFKKVILENSSGSYVQTKLLKATPGTNTLNLNFEKILLKKVNFDFENKVALQRIEANINTSEIKANEIDLRTGRIDLAIGALEQAGEVAPDEALVQYNLACYCSLAGDKQQALAYLARALAMDAHYRDLIGAEADFDPIRSDPDFQAITGATV